MLMNRKEWLLRMLDTTFDKESWHAPFKTSIEGLTAEQARWRPVGGETNTIWENVNHLIYYKERLVANLEDREWTLNLDNNETFSLTEQINDDKEWIAVVERALSVQGSLKEALSKVPTEQLERNSLVEKLVDITFHDAYHTGQIIQIRKMQGSWPSHRDC